MKPLPLFQFLSVCSGIEAASAAWHPLGWQAVAFSEIEPFPCAVLAHHWPDIPNQGDMTKYETWTISWGPPGTVRILAGGTPCQAFSVAGARGGLADVRGNLCLTFCEIADKENPDWIIWENVPGVLSMRDNAFGCFLGRLCGAGEAIQPPGGKWPTAGVVTGPQRTAAWRILDAQYFGLAQRRRRVFVLAVPGARNWRCAAALFPVGDGLRWNPPARGEAREGVAGTLKVRAGGGCGPEGIDAAAAGHIVSHDPACTLTAREYKGPLPEADLSTVVAHTLRGEGFDATEDGTGRGVPLITATLTQNYASHYGRTAGNNGGIAENQLIAAPLTGSPYADNVSREGNLVPMAFQTRGSNIDLGQDVTGTIGSNADRASGSAPCIAFDTTQITSPGNVSAPRPGDACHPLAAGGHAPAVAFQTRIARNGRGQPEDVCPALSGADAGETSDMRPCVAGPAFGVRRLTPRECAKLQGFADDHLDITYRGKPAADGPKYRALGNSMAVPCMRWLGRRIEFVTANY